MSDQETPKHEAGASETSHGENAAEKGGPQTADRVHACLLEQYRQSLSEQGGEAHRRWGLSWHQSLSDEEAMTQRQHFGFAAVDALDHYNTGCLHVARENMEEAVKSFDKALALNPELSEAAFNRALALDTAGHVKAAREAWKAYLEKHESSEEAAEIKQRLTALADA
jgi:tetratricopeptide (TPR) repeat protein